ncbi:MAG: hypothetical protein EA412_13295 [Chitinophagaceae bacterium]|nr:MAG: hypothetical protein EA412_13295 [Chitinophagaceae bacterium]
MRTIYKKHFSKIYVNFVRESFVMDITELREKLHKHIERIDEPFLKVLHAMLEEYENSMSKLSEAEKKAVDKGIRDIENGKTYDHDDVMRQMREKYPELYRRK